MSETYQAKRQRWLRLLDSLPAGLREHVSLRNVEAVAALNPQAQARLAEALQAGLKRLPRALEQLRADPDTSVADLLQPPLATDTSDSDQNTENIQKELADLIQLCFPDMPRLAAEALAGADVLEAARQAAGAHAGLFASSHLRTDFVLLVVYGLLRQSQERLEEIIQATPAFRQSLLQSDLPWKPNEWSE